MKKEKENWTGEECSKIEENLRKNKSNRMYPLVEDLTTEKRESYYMYNSRLLRKMPYRRTRDTKLLDRILL